MHHDPLPVATRHFLGFNDDQLWYYRSLVAAFREALQTDSLILMVEELERVVQEMERIAQDG